MENNGRTVPRHPALVKEDEIQNAARANRELAMQNEALQMQGRQVADENMQMKSAMQDPNIDTNIGGLAQPQQQQGKMSPIDALYDGVSQGATMADLEEVGMIQPALAAMEAEGYTPDDVSRVFAELEKIGSQPKTGQVNPYSVGQ